MIVKWEPEWYALDQCIVVGDIDFFYLTKDNLHFFGGLLSSRSSSCDEEIRAKILKITHPELGAVKGIITIGFDYFIYLCNGDVIIVNAEENPGEIYDSEYAIREWSFDVQIHMIEKTGLTASERSNILNHNQKKSIKQERIRKYKTLLGLSEADWDR